jgi:hypothetical protein
MYVNKHIPIEEGTGKEVFDEELKEIAQLIQKELKK